MEKTMIRLERVSRCFRAGGEQVTALRNITLGVRRGEYLAVTGASGSGKSTLLNIIGCLDGAAQGEYRLNGKSVFTLGDKKRTLLRSQCLGFIFQGFNLIPTLTAEENVALPLCYRRFSSSERLRLAREALERVGLDDRRSHYPTQLSGGQQQRVAIARAMAARPEVILADEPCGSLDSVSGGIVMDMLEDMNRKGKTIVLITHDFAAAGRAGRIITVSDGEIISDSREK